MSSKLTNYLNYIDKEPIEEIGALGTTVTVIITGKVMADISKILYGAAQLHQSFKMDEELTNSVNNILGSGDKWRVHTYPEPMPNAFAVGGRDVYITTGLKKLLNKREQEAVLLHEVYHNKDLHIWKALAATSIFTYMVAYVAIQDIAPGTSYLLAGVLAFIMENSAEILYRRFIGRRHELKADDFALKNGYGKDLISAFEKIQELAKRFKTSRPCNTFCQIERKISDAIDEHPSIQQRINILLKKTKELNAAMKHGFVQIQKFVAGVFESNG